MMQDLRLLAVTALSAIVISLFSVTDAQAQCPPVLDDVAVTDVSCPGANDGSICITVSGGFPDYIYQIFNGPQFFQFTTSATSHCFTGLGAGISSWVVQVVAEDGVGGTCNVIPSAVVAIDDPDPFDIQITTVDETCPDSNDGGASVVVTGGSGPYTYLWTPFPEVDDDIDGLDSGTYDLTVTDDNGCSETVPYTINQAPDWAVTLTPTPVSCNGGSDGAITSSGVTGGTPPYDFLWAPDGQITENISGLEAGSYTLTVTDADNCTFTPPAVDVSEPTPIVITETHTDVSCAGLDDGAINITVSGGVGGYTFNWSNGAVTEDVSGLAAGFYLVTVTDGNGCTAALPITIIDGSNLSVSSFVSTASCGESNGAIDLTVSGGSGNYGFVWQPGGMVTEDVSGLPAGIYTVIVTDNIFGCADTLDIAVNNFPGHTVSGVVTDGTNCVSNDGSIDVTVTDGSGDFTFSWSPGSQVTEDISGLTAGTYVVTVTDNITGCVAFGSFNVQAGNEVDVTASVTQPACGALDGALDITISGGTGPYSVLWSNSAVTEDISGLGSGIYSVSITDANGCPFDTTFTLSDQGTPAVTATLQSPTCDNTNDGSVTLVLSGGVGPFTFNWSTGATTQDISGLNGGTYSVIITDQGTGCVLIESYTLTTPSELEGTMNITPVTCFGGSDGAIDVTISGGVMPYTITWNPGNIVSEDLIGISAGAYTISVVDANGCSASGSITVSEPSEIIITETHVDVSCSGAEDGSIDVSVSGGSGSYTYAWLPDGEITEDLSGLGSGTYDLTVTDSDGCTQTISITINEPATFDLNPSFTDATCNGVCDGTAGVSPTGGTLPYTFAWVPPAGNVSGLTSLCAGNYQVTVTDANGCSDVAQFTISDNQIQVSVATTNVSCNGDCDGTASATVTGSNAPFTYQWVETGGNGPTETDLCAGTYTLNITDNLGCTVQETVVITEPDPIQITLDVTDVSCNGGSDGSIDMTVIGGTGSYTYQWFPGGQTTEDISNLPAGTYSVVVTDANGCTSSQIVLGGSFSGGTLALPDGNGASYSTSIPVTGFPGGATLTDINDFGSVCLNIEHSYLGDLDITLSCPSGQSVDLLQSIGIGPAGEVFLGDANDLGPDGVPGVGWDYCWSATPTFGTMGTEAGNGNTVPTLDGDALPPGTYTSVQSLNGLLGCTMNGNWTITVTDNFSLDDGFIFDWSLDFQGGGSNDSLATVNEPTPIQITSNVTDASCGVCDGSVTITPSNGQAPYIFLWNTGATTATLTNICAGIYQVQVTDANGCMEEFFVPVDNNTGPTAGNPVITDATCFGTCDGAATLSPVGGTAPYTYQWVPGGQNTNSASGLCPGTYFVQIQDDLGCIYTEPITIGSPPQIQIGQTVTNSTCGLCDGEISLTPITGSAPYSYDWSPAVVGNVPDATGLCAGVYNIIVTDGTGCEEPVTVLLNDFPSATLLMAGTDPSCSGVCDGTATVTTVGGVAPFTYQWDDAATQITPTAIDLCEDLYTVTVTDGNGCVAVNQITLSDPDTIGLSILIVDNGTCAGNCDGSITVIPSGGTIPFTYLWDDSNAQTTATASNLCAGTYTVTVTDANGCQDVVSGTVNNPVGLTATVTGTDVSCNGACDGSAIVAVQGGTGPFTFQWDDLSLPQNDTVTGLCPGTYTVTVTDANNCDFSVPVTIVEPDPIVITFSNVVNLQCDGVCIGEATADVIGGVGSYTYLWMSGGQTTQTATGLCASSYTVTVTDDNGCTAQNTVVITGPNGLTSSITNQVNATCNGDCDGSATVTPAGGTAPYTYQWNDPGSQTDSTATGLCAGTYSVTVTDANGCISVTTVTITQPEALIATTTANDPDCFGVCDGTSTAFTTGGTFPYTYQWNDPNGQTTITAVNLCPGPYDVDVTDANGCTATASVNIFQPTEITAATSAVNATCGQCNGQAAVSPTGGVGPYTYLWGDGQTTATITGLCPGVYNVDVYDQFGCVENFIIPVNNDGGPTSASVTANDATCYGSCDGSATVSNVVGGIAPYTYLWVPGGQTSTSVTGLCAGTYNVQVIDSAGCIFTQPVTINEPAQIIPAYISTPASCGNSDGAITINPAGGDGGPYTFTWVPVVSTTNTATGLDAGIYTVTVADGSGCDTTVVIPVNNELGPQVTWTGTNVTCNGVCDGTATVTITNGQPPYTVSWNDPQTQTGTTATNLCAGVYAATVTDANGCITVRMVTITEPLEISVSQPIVSDATCPGACDGTATVVASGGTLSYTVVWTPSGGNLATATALCAGQYTATITDANGCTEAVAVTVDEPDPIVITTSTQDASCFGVCDGEAYASATGGSGGFTYQWDDPNTTANDTVTDLCAGIYNVIATDMNGCPDTAQVTINEPADIVINVTTQGVTCNGDCDGEAYASASGGTGPYTYQWDDPNLTQNDTVTGLCEGIYNVIVTDANGCTSATAVIITEPDPLQVIGQGTDITCGGQCDGTATALVQGGTPAYTYLWDDPNAQTSATATGLCAGTYNVVVTDANGCTATTSVTITEPAELVATVSVTNPTCGGVCDGSATVSITGGTGQVTILWSNLETGTTTNNLCAGNYFVIVVDANLCSDTVNFILTEPPVLNANITSTVHVLCAGSCTGEATVTGSGGTPPYSYQWSGGVTTTTVTGLCVGTHSVVITDDIGCTATASVTINDDNALAVTAPITTPISCTGDCDGTATVFPSGGVGPYTYSWNDNFNQTTQTAVNLCAGTYIVTVTDSQVPACTTQATITISDPPALTSTSLATEETCGNACDGTATASPVGGTGTYTYLWNDPSSQVTQTATDLCVGTWTVTISDANGCVVQNSVSVTGPDPIVSNAVTTASSCSNVANGAINLTASGGVGNLTYAWNPGGADTEDLSGILFGTYTVTITDATGCEVDATYSVGTLTNIEADAGEDRMLCLGDSLLLDGFGGNTYLWSPAESLSDATIASPYASPVETTEYILTVNIGNCVDSDSVIVTLYSVPPVDAGNDVTIPTGGTIGLNANGVVTEWTYTWTPVESLDDPDITNPQATPEETTMYYVTVTDENGCTNTDSVQVEVVPGIRFPDGISPNGDGINDSWVIDNIELFQDAIVEIYNRWGQMLWQSAPGYPIQWDGRYEGNDLPVGTYYYVIRSENLEQPFTGPITLVR